MDPRVFYRSISHKPNAFSSAFTGFVNLLARIVHRITTAASIPLQLTMPPSPQELYFLDPSHPLEFKLEQSEHDSANFSIFTCWLIVTFMLLLGKKFLKHNKTTQLPSDTIDDEPSSEKQVDLSVLSMWDSHEESNTTFTPPPTTPRSIRHIGLPDDNIDANNFCSAAAVLLWDA